MTAEIDIVSKLTAPQRRLLVECCRHDRAQRLAIEERPTRIYNAYYAGGPHKRIARRLSVLQLATIECYERGGADVVPTDLGRKVAEQCPEWKVHSISDRRDQKRRCSGTSPR